VVSAASFVLYQTLSVKDVKNWFRYPLNEQHIMGNERWFVRQ